MELKERNELITNNMNIVHKVAPKYYNCGIPIKDLLQEGYVGLVIAADRFDPAKKVPFDYYAKLWIKKIILQAINNLGRTIRVPTEFSYLLVKYKRVEAEYFKKNGKKISLNELETTLGVSKKIIKRLKQYNDSFSVDTPSTKDNITIERYIRNSSNPYSIVYEKLEIEELIEMTKRANLNDEEKEVLYYYFGFGDYTISASKMAEIKGKSRQGICDIKDKAIWKIKKEYKKALVKQKYNI